MHYAALLRSYSETGSEHAFAEFVRKCLPMVFGAAVRRVGGDIHLAEDVTQMVFAAVSRDARKLAQHPDLTGWLFTTTRFLAAKTVRGERRRQHRERVFSLEPSGDEAGEEEAGRLRPVLDELLMDLRALDRQMLLMRFYGGLRLAEIAGQCNSSENAVQKRIDRALARLNAMLTRRGITSTAAALALSLEQLGAVTVPAGLASASITAGLTGGSSGAGIVAVPKFASFAKSQLYVAVALVTASAVGIAWYYRENARPRAESVRESTVRPIAPEREQVAKVPVATDLPQSASAVAPASAPAQNRARETAALPMLPVPHDAPGTLLIPAGDAKIPLKVEYPKPLFSGSPRPLNFPNLEPRAGSRIEMLVPAATVLLSRGKPVSSSDRLPVIGDLSLVTDGNKNGVDGTYVELGPNLQWIQIDLGESALIHAVALWHFHAQARVYHDVVVQVSEDRTFSGGVATLFNNDHDNSSKLGAGKDAAYVETSRGKLIAGRSAKGRYVRCYSNGNTSDELNHYCEVEVYGEAGR